MGTNVISPFIRLASYSLVRTDWELQERILLDYELIYIDQGCMSLTMDGKEHLCQEGTIILLRPNQPHIIKKVGNSILSQPHIHFDLSFQEDSKDVYVNFKNYDQLSAEEKLLIRKDILPEWNLELPTVIILPDADEVKKLLYQIIDTFIARNPFYEMVCTGLFLQLLAILLRQYNQQTPLPVQHIFSDSLGLSQVKNYISQNYSQNITLDFLAKQFGLSKFYLTRKFKEIYGKSVIEYLNAVRLERAMFFLKNDNLNVSQISTMLGFSSVYVFSHFFKNATGKSPMEYRKHHAT